MMVPGAAVAIPDSEPSLRLDGGSKVVFDWSRQRCEASNIPDAAVRAFRGSDGRVQVILAHTQNRRLIGQDFNHLRPDCRVVLSSGEKDNPAAYDDREWIASVYTVDGRSIVALVHDEYQGHQHSGRCPSNTYQRCWYNALTLAVSHDGGRSYVQAPGAQKFVAGLPEQYEPDVGPAGIFSPSNIVRNPRDGYFYSVIRVIDPRTSVRGTCVMRTGQLFQARSWRVWDGASYSLPFVDPYAAGGQAGTVCTPVGQGEIGEMTDSLTYNTYLRQFLLVGVASRVDQARGRPVWGIYYALSDDLIHWTDRRLLMQASLPWKRSCGDRKTVAYPSVIDPHSSSRSFETSGRRPYVYFTLFHYTSCKSTLDRDLVRIRLLVSR
jgi:hypothetical protein